MGSSGQSRESASKGRAKVGLEAGIRGIEQLTARDHHDVDALPARRKGGLAKNLTDQPLGAVSANGIAQLSRRNDPHSRSAGSIRRHNHRQIAALTPAAGFKNLLKLGSASKPAGGGKAEGHFWACRPRLLRRRNRQALPPFCPSTLQHKATLLRGHPHEKAVGAPAAAPVRLESTLHDVGSPVTKKNSTEKLK
jgi:hypothetical protein